jgi:hypothetical protein
LALNIWNIARRRPIRNGPRYEIALRTSTGGTASLYALDVTRPIEFRLPATASGDPSKRKYVVLGLPGLPPVPLLFGEVAGDSSEVVAPLLEVPRVMQLIVVTSDGYNSQPTALSTQHAPALAPTRLVVKDNVYPGASQPWGGTGWDIRNPVWSVLDWGDRVNRAKEWLPKGAIALAALGLPAPRLGLTKEGKYLTVLVDNGNHHFAFEADDGSANTFIDLEDLYGRITGAIYLNAAEPSPDQEGVEHPGFGPPSCPHEIFHAVVGSKWIQMVCPADADLDLVRRGAVKLPLNLPAHPVAGHRYFPEVGFEDGMALMVGHLVVEGRGDSQYPLRGEWRGTYLDWPLAIGNADGACGLKTLNITMLQKYGAADFFTWLVRHYDGGNLDFLPYLLNYWADKENANYDVMNDLRAWFPKGPATLAEAYVEYVTQRAYLRDDTMSSGAVASQLRGSTNQSVFETLGDGNQHQVLQGLWSETLASKNVSAGAQDHTASGIYPFAARAFILEGLTAGDVQITTEISGASASELTSCKIDAQISREAIVCATPSKKQSLSGMLWSWSKKEDRIIYRRLRECAASKVARCVKAGRGAVAQSSFGRSRPAGSRRSTVWNRRRRPPMEINAFAGLFGVGSTSTPSARYKP